MQVPAVGREAVREFSESVLRAFPDFRYTIRYPMCFAADGSRCAVPWLITATNLGPLDPPGFGPTGKRTEFHGVDLLEFQGRKVKRIDTYFDATKPAEQLLSLTRPQPGSRLERVLVRLQRIRAAWLRRRGER
jgi:predicted ester cyclase